MNNLMSSRAFQRLSTVTFFFHSDSKFFKEKLKVVEETKHATLLRVKLLSCATPTDRKSKEKPATFGFVHIHTVNTYTYTGPLDGLFANEVASKCFGSIYMK